MSRSEWCEFCRDHFEESHWDEFDNHKVGPEWGWVGAREAEVLSLRLAVAAALRFVNAVGESEGYYCHADAEVDVVLAAARLWGVEIPSGLADDGSS